MSPGGQPRGAGRFLREESALLAFGLVLAFVSNFGQTFFVSLLVPGMQEEFDLSSAQFGALYSGATLASAALLPWTGGRLDRMRLPLFTTGVVLLLAGSAALAALAPTLVLLAVALTGIRLGGQGLASHTAYTVMARYYRRRRGTALALTGLGFPLGEAVLPLAAVTLLALTGWRGVWTGVALLLPLLALPLLLGLLRVSGREMAPGKVEAELRERLRGQPAREHPGSRAMGRVPGEGRGEGEVEALTRGEVLRDAGFWLVLPAALGAPFWATALFLYQLQIGAERGWDGTLMAAAFTGFALVRIGASLATGPLVDRLSARLLFPLAPLPLGGAMGILLLVDARWGAPAFMAAMGVAVGFGGTMKPALWAESYGTRHLGSIKALVSTLMVTSTAGSPVLAGWLLDREGGLDLLLQIGLATVLAATALALWGLTRGRASPGGSPGHAPSS